MSISYLCCALECSCLPRRNLFDPKVSTVPPLASTDALRFTVFVNRYTLPRGPYMLSFSTQFTSSLGLAAKIFLNTCHIHRCRTLMREVDPTRLMPPPDDQLRQQSAAFILVDVVVMLLPAASFRWFYK